MEQARDDLASELASSTPNYSNAVAGAVRYCPMIAQVLRSLEQTVRIIERIFSHQFCFKNTCVSRNFANSPMDKCRARIYAL